MKKNKQLTVGDFTVSWLRGGTFAMDGGAMFGPVPKVLWSKKQKAEDDNTIQLYNNAILVQTKTNNIIIDTGVGNKLTDKQLKIFQVTSPWLILEDLQAFGLKNTDIDTVILTHCDFDHAGGAVMHDAAGDEVVTFPNAKYVVQKDEWYDVQNVNSRSASTYWPNNFSALGIDQIELIEGDNDICPGVHLIQTGGHTMGHQIVELTSNGEVAVHLGDLFPTIHHANPLWVMAFDNFPLDVIAAKERLLKHYIDQNAWFLMYHDVEVRACRMLDDFTVTDSV